jgi:hypothetical protein
MADITFRDCDIIRTNSVAMDIQHSDRAAIRNILYDNIRWEIDDIHEAPVFQESDGQRYIPNTTWIPHLLVIEIVKNMWSKDAQSGTVDNVAFRNIQVLGNHPFRSRISGRDATHMVANVTIENLRQNNVPLLTPKAAHLTTNAFTENIRIIPGK